MLRNKDQRLDGVLNFHQSDGSPIQPRQKPTLHGKLVDQNSSIEKLSRENLKNFFCRLQTNATICGQNN
jgi:hypothetical protein